MCLVLKVFNKKLFFCSQSDPSILGGMIVSIGDKYVDMSTKSKIQKLTTLIRET